jgi:hypothetical protein
MELVIKISKSRRFIILEENTTKLLDVDDSGDEVFSLNDGYEDIAFLEIENTENIINDLGIFYAETMKISQNILHLM